MTSVREYKDYKGRKEHRSETEEIAFFKGGSGIKEKNK
jgi:hypothetical protein